eukprot:Gb_02783 [translate_table: standard]
MGELNRGGEGDQIKLLTFWSSPFGRKVEIALRAKGIQYQSVQEDLKNKSHLLLQGNPVYKKVPVLLHDGRSVCESRFIVEYIDDTWPSAAPQLLPKNPYDRYLVRFWADFFDNKIRNISIMYADSSDESNGKLIREEYVEMWITLDSALPELLSRGNVLHDGNNALNYMDACLGSWIPWLQPLEICAGLILPSSERCPLLHKWIHAVGENPVVRSTFPTPQQMMEYARKRFHLD